MVLGLLAVVWIAVLAPPLLRKGAETRKADSIGDFRRQLVVLQRTGPSVIAPAHTRIDYERRAAMSAAYQTPAYQAPAGPAGRVGPAGVLARRAGTARPAGSVRGRALRRRRNVLLGLVASTLLFIVLGAVPGMHVLLAGAAVFAVMLAGFVALLVNMRNAAAEREMKLTFLPGAPAYEGGPLLRRSAN